MTDTRLGDSSRSRASPSRPLRSTVSLSGDVEQLLRPRPASRPQELCLARHPRLAISPSAAARRRRRRRRPDRRPATGSAWWVPTAWARRRCCWPWPPRWSLTAVAQLAPPARTVGYLPQEPRAPGGRARLRLPGAAPAGCGERRAGGGHLPLSAAAARPTTATPWPSTGGCRSEAPTWRSGPASCWPSLGLPDRARIGRPPPSRVARRPASSWRPCSSAGSTSTSSTSRPTTSTSTDSNASRASSTTSRPAWSWSATTRRSSSGRSRACWSWTSTPTRHALRGRLAGLPRREGPGPRHAEEAYGRYVGQRDDLRERAGSEAWTRGDQPRRQAAARQRQEHQGQVHRQRRGAFGRCQANRPHAGAARSGRQALGEGWQLRSTSPRRPAARPRGPPRRRRGRPEDLPARAGRPPDRLGRPCGDRGSERWRQDHPARRPRGACPRRRRALARAVGGGR